MATITREDRQAARSVARVGAALVRAVDLVAESLRSGGRLIYAGAGTSGRLGVLDASECPPTFGVPPGRVVGVIAGGRRALWQAVEGAEDRGADARRALRRLGVGRRDVVCGICASGVTPFALAALEEGRRRGARTIVVTCAPSPALRELVDVVVAPRPGPEVLTGSTRMKAGTAQKIVLNLLSSLVMIRLGRVYRGLMVHMQPTNAKLRQRAAQMVAVLAGCSEEAAAAAVAEADGDVKRAVLLALGVPAAQARALLERHDGNLRAAIAEGAPRGA